jgi:hypothetical protein
VSNRDIYLFRRVLTYILNHHVYKNWICVFSKIFWVWIASQIQIDDEWVRNSVWTPSEQFDKMMMSTLYSNNTLSAILRVIAHRYTCHSTRTHYPNSEPTNLWSYSLILRAGNINLIVFSLKWLEHEPTIYPNWGEHTNRVGQIICCYIPTVEYQKVIQEKRCYKKSKQM